MFNLPSFHSFAALNQQIAQAPIKQPQQNRASTSQGAQQALFNNTAQLANLAKTMYSNKGALWKNPTARNLAWTVGRQLLNNTLASAEQALYGVPPQVRGRYVPPNLVIGRKQQGQRSMPQFCQTGTIVGPGMRSEQALWASQSFYTQAAAKVAISYV